jgi:4-alpha-glucanotransferase
MALGQAEMSEMLQRSSGILLPVFSLPGPYGIGGFGPEALAFASQAAKAGFSYWQVLPFSPTSYGNSPYQGLSAYAGNLYFIDPAELHTQGLLTRAELAQAEFTGEAARIDYGWLYRTRERLLELAWQRRDSALATRVADFAARHASWLQDYALFRAIKSHFGEKPWWEWPDAGLRAHAAADLKAVALAETERIQFIAFVQYEFDRQWQALKLQINRLGVRIVGDMPIYVAADSSDAWACRDYFETDGSGLFSRVAGVPPDYFAKDGQLWGNPLYRWPVLAANGYQWWIDRIRSGLKTFDLLRIDHFRGFESYWAVPASAATARHGTWQKGPAMHLFAKILASVPADAIIAEDLGDIDEAVRIFLRETSLPGMKVMQFAFAPDGKVSDRPHHFPENCVAYTGTHDNDTLAGWLRSCPPAELALVRDYCGLPDATGSRADCLAIIRCLWQTAATLAIAPAQDFLGLDATARLNRPGTLEDNWVFRFTRDEMSRLDMDWIGKLNHAFERAPQISGHPSQT